MDFFLIFIFTSAERNDSITTYCTTINSIENNTKIYLCRSNEVQEFFFHLKKSLRANLTTHPQTAILLFEI